MAGPTIEFLGRVSDSQLQDLYAGCRAVLFLADEDFGIVPVAKRRLHGRPVIAYGHGGSKETVVPFISGSSESPTGVLFGTQDVQSLRTAILKFEKNEASFSPTAARANALRFDTKVFSRRMLELIDQALAEPTTNQLDFLGVFDRDHEALPMSVMPSPIALQIET